MRTGAFLALSLAAASLVVTAVRANDDSEAIRIGVLNDQSGVYSDITGFGSVLAARLAVEDFGGRVLGRPVEVLVGDHQNKPDVGSAIARKWYDVDSVSAIFDVPNSGVALAVLEVARAKQKIVVFSSPASPDITGKLCAGTSFQWAYNSYALAAGTARAMIKSGLDTWFFLTVDSNGGHLIERDATEFVAGAGGRVLGSVRHPLNTSDFSSFLLRAQQSGAKVIGLANAGNDTVNAIKQASEFGLVTAGQRIASLLVVINNVHAIGLAEAQGLMAVESFYWDLNEETRRWSKRFMTANKGAPANMFQAGVYSGVLHYLKAVAKAGTTDAAAVATAMKALPVEDFYTKGAVVRSDGAVTRNMYLLRVKNPAASKGDWDVYDVVTEIPGKDAFRSLADGGCPLAK